MSQNKPAYYFPSLRKPSTISAKKLVPTLFIILIVSSPAAFALSGLLLSHHAKRLADKAIEELVEISRSTGGVGKIGKRLGQMQLPDEVLEDTFLRIAVARQFITPAEAVKLFSSLSGVKGFRSALRKAIGNNPNKTKGHLHELRVAAQARDQGFDVQEIDKSFTAGSKQWTDIDLVLEKNGRTFLVETKDYAPVVPLNMVSTRGDMQALSEYAKTMPDVPTVLVFTVSNIPENSRTLTLLIAEAKRRNIELLFGNPTQQAIRLNTLELVQ